MQGKATIAKIALIIGVLSVLSAMGIAAPEEQAEISDAPAESIPSIAPVKDVAEFIATHPGSAIIGAGDAVTKIYGRVLETGTSAQQTAEIFRLRAAAVLEAKPEDIKPAPVHGWADNVQPVMYDSLTDRYRFTAVRYKQQRGGLDVFGTAVMMLIRNEPGHPLVLVNAQTRNLGDFAVGAVAERDPPTAEARQGALDHFDRIAQFGGAGRTAMTNSNKVIFAGVESQRIAPRLADAMIIERGAEKWKIVVDATTGQVLHEEPMICRIELIGNAQGRATQGEAADFCEPESWVSLPQLEVDVGGTTVYTNAAGAFSVANVPPGPITVSAKLRGRWFEVFNAAGPDTTDTRIVTPPFPASLSFNQTNANELMRAEVNAYVYANKVREFVLMHNPAYPTLNASGFPVNVNRSDALCPGNAWYDLVSPSINFCRAGVNGSGQAFPNTAWSSIIYHEFGHHLVQMAGSGQGQYGEGLGDALSVIILDTPKVALGYFNSCNEPLRNADNVIQVPCAGSIHFCGQALAGCIWETRNELVATHPSEYKNILGSLTVNSILLHVGAAITADLIIDFLTLDDDNGNIFDGTPHYNELAAGFGEHGIPAPVLDPIGITFPDGLPEYTSPTGESTLRMKVQPISGSHAPGQAWVTFHIGGEMESMQLQPTGEMNTYSTTVPAAACGTRIDYTFAAQATNGAIITSPYLATAMHTSFAAVGATLTAEDHFETNSGWVSDPLDSADGMWERGTPVGDIAWNHAPAIDSDGSGQCWVTANRAGNSDVDDGSVRLTSPTLDLSAGPSILAYDYYLRLVNENGNDRMVVEMTDGIQPWVEVIRHDEDSGFAWREHRVTPNDMFNAGLQQTATMQIRFTVSDLTPQSVVEAGIDNIRVQLLQCEDDPKGLVGDLNGDMIVNVFDLFLLLGAWGDCADCPPSCPADLTSDCTVNVFDLFDLLSAWSQ